MGRLLINADDFGLTAGVNRAVEELHQAGFLTSATLMARGKAAAEAVAIAQANPALGVGCHLTLVDCEPALPLARIPSLIDRRTQRFYNTLSEFLPRLALGAVRASEIEAESFAQLELLQSQGLRLTHIDTHKHVHSFPAVLRPVLRAARRAGVGAVRNPFEPEWSLRLLPSASGRRKMAVRLHRLLRARFLRIVAEEGMRTTDGAIGVSATGALRADSVRAVCAHLPAGDWELVTHPGYLDDDLRAERTVLLESRETEREALREIAGLEPGRRVSFAAL